MPHLKVNIFLKILKVIINLKKENNYGL